MFETVMGCPGGAEFQRSKKVPRPRGMMLPEPRRRAGFLGDGDGDDIMDRFL
jgi:hypothetical protein